MNRSGRALDDREQVWNRLLNTSCSIEVKSVRILESNVFAPQVIELRRVVAFIGLHGTGKTLLLRMIEAAFGYPNPASAPPFIAGTKSDAPGLGGVLELELDTPSGLVSRRIDLSAPDESRRQVWKDVLGDSFTAWHISPLYLFSELSVLLQEYYFVTRVVAEEEGRDLPKRALNALGNILGRVYDRVTVHSAFMGEQRGDSAFYIPYISASIGDQEFDSSMMSQGELWVHYALSWFLEGEIGKGDLALLDEPESFLAMRAQRPFMDEVARRALSIDAQLMIATHSPEILARFPLSNILMCISSNDGVQIIKPKSMAAVREHVGLEVPVRMLILVEDEIAKTVLQSLFARYDRALVSEADVIFTNGSGSVRRGLEILANSGRLVCLGVLDADEKIRTDQGRKDAQPQTDNLPILFLPGSGSPENELLSAGARNALWASDRLGVGLEDLLEAIGACRGLDHQYWLRTVASHLGVAEPVVTHELIQTWLRDRSIQQEAERLVKEIRALLRSGGSRS